MLTSSGGVKVELGGGLTDSEAGLVRARVVADAFPRGRDGGGLIVDIMIAFPFSLCGRRRCGRRR